MTDSNTNPIRTDGRGKGIDRRRYLKLLGISTGAAALAGCSSDGDNGDSASDQPEPPEEPTGEVVLSQTYDPQTLDPATYANITDMQIAVNIFDRLVAFDIGSTDIGPGLAKDWEFVNDGNSVEFELEEGVQFHKGYGELTAADVEAHIERIADPETGSPEQQTLSQLGYQSTEIVSDYEFRLNFDQPANAVPYVLAQQVGMIPSADAVDDKGEDFGFDPVGAGMFEFDAYEPNEQTVLTAFDDYWRDGYPLVERAIYRPISETQTAWSSFQADEIDVRRVNSTERYEQLQNQDDVKFTESTGLITRFVGFNHQVEPLDDKRVRQALNYAANTQSIVDQMYSGLSTQTSSFISPGVNHRSEDVPTYEHNPDRAQELLEEAGYGDGFELDWWVPQVSRFTDPATVFQSNWEEIGVDINIEVQEVGTYVSEVFGSEHDVPMFIHSLGQTPVPDSFMYNSFHSSSWAPDGGNYWLYENENVDEWLNEATSTMDEDTRQEMFTNVQQQINEDAVGVWIDHEKFVFPHQERVYGFESDPMRRMNLDNTYVSE